MNEFAPVESPISQIYQKSLNHVYDSIHQEGLDVTTQRGIVPVEIDPLSDARRSLDLYFVPPKSLQDSVEMRILRPLSRLFLNLESPQAVYDPSWLHLSIFTIVKSEASKEERAPFDMLPSYLNAVEETLFGSKPVEVSFSRLCLTPHGIILGGIPQDMTIQDARRNLASNLERRGLSFLQRRPPFSTHMTVARWINPLSPSKVGEVIDFINRKNGIEIWRGYLDRVGFGIGTYIMDPERVVTIKEFKLR